jgi:hypothetical protein
LANDKQGITPQHFTPTNPIFDFPRSKFAIPSDNRAYPEGIRRIHAAAPAGRHICSRAIKTNSKLHRSGIVREYAAPTELVVLARAVLQICRAHGA